MKRRRNISWPKQVDDLAEKLAKRDGCDVSALLARLVREAAAYPDAISAMTAILRQKLGEGGDTSGDQSGASHQN